MIGEQGRGEQAAWAKEGAADTRSLPELRRLGKESVAEATRLLEDIKKPFEGDDRLEGARRIHAAEVERNPDSLLKAYLELSEQKQQALSLYESLKAGHNIFEEIDSQSRREEQQHKLRETRGEAQRAINILSAELLRLEKEILKEE